MTDAGNEVHGGRLALWAGLLLVAWGGSSSLFKEELSPTVFWALFVSVAILIIAVPSWLYGRRAKRQYLESQNS